MNKELEEVKEAKTIGSLLGLMAFLYLFVLRFAWGYWSILVIVSLAYFGVCYVVAKKIKMRDK